MGVGHTNSESAQHFWLRKTHHRGLNWGRWCDGILSLTLYQLSHPITPDNQYFARDSKIIIHFVSPWIWMILHGWTGKTKSSIYLIYPLYVLTQALEIKRPCHLPVSRTYWRLFEIQGMNQLMDGACAATARKDDGIMLTGIYCIPDDIPGQYFKHVCIDHIIKNYNIY